MNSEDPYIFISYVRENKGLVDKLYTTLINQNIKVWMDRKSIFPGQRWKYSIRKAIKQGSFFIACFSKEYNEKNHSYMNEELTVAIDLMRRKPFDLTWFIPVKVSECLIPDRDIGAGETLNDIQSIDLYSDWDSGVAKLLSILAPQKKKGCRYHITHIFVY